MPTQNDTFQEFVLDQLDGLPALACKRMFGGAGLYSGEVFFGIFHKARLYFKTGDPNRDDYTSRGMEQFKPTPKQRLASFHEVPPDIIENASELKRWAQRAITVAKISSASK